MRSKGRHCRGERHRDAKLTENDVINIRIFDIPLRKLAKLYGVDANYPEHKEPPNMEARHMTHYNHLEPGLGGPTFSESIFVAMLLVLWIFIMLGCAVGELTVRLFPPKRHG